MELLIKGMVCRHCVEAVKRLLVSEGLPADDVSLGRANIPDGIDAGEMARLAAELEKMGFGIVRGAEDGLVEQIKLAIMEHVRHPHECRLNLSACLEDKLHVTYDYMSRAFSSREGRTIEKFHIAQRVEWVKELLNYGEMSVSEIADMIGYSSVAHLSRQFKSVTGMTPTEYLKSSDRSRNALNEL